MSSESGAELRLFKHCPKCATELSLASRGGRMRQVCPSCSFVVYRNPVVGVAVILTEGDKVLLGRRSRGDYRGQWCVPCGYVEWDEDVREAARRETKEETGLDVAVGQVYAVHSNFHDPTSHTVGVWFRGTIVGGSIHPGDDIDAAEFISLQSLPSNLAFPTDRLVLEQLKKELGGVRA